MDHKALIKTCKELGCCNACCLRYLGLKNPTAFENSYEFVQKYLECAADVQPDNLEATLSAITATTENEDCTPVKKMKTHDVCVSCLGILQEENWPECLAMVKEIIDKKRYECQTFACALSAPLATILREKAITLHLAESFSEYDEDTVTPLKEAWKWSMGAALARAAGRELQSGAVAPLLVTLHLEYPHEDRELQAVGCGRRGLTRRAVQAAGAALRRAGWLPPPRAPAPARPASVACAHAPLYLAGRYVKTSRTLPQTPWVVRGERIADSSVQEVIFSPLARLFGLSAAEADHRLKFVAAGREDVDVRCLGTGRPFAVEVADPQREPRADELARVCEEISASGTVRVASLVPVSREKLTELKRGEESKCKTYEALCVKLGAEGVSAQDVERAECAVRVRQATPLRVLHRRPLLARARALAVERAAPVPGHPALLVLRLRTDAGTYVKEWAHGDLRRTQPSLRHLLQAPADILALDVTEVHLEWP